MIRIALAVALALTLSACAGDDTPPAACPPPPPPAKVIVPVACVARANITPEPAHVANRLTGQAGHDLEVVDSSALELRTWGEGLYAHS